MPGVRVSLVDPPAYTPPYDYSLASALARAGAEVELVTSRYPYGPAPVAAGFTVREAFYRRTMAGDRGTTARRALRLAEHVPGMLAQRDLSPADVVHYQWLTLEALDSLMLARGVPRVCTSHNVLRRGRGALRERAARAAIRRMDALIVHTEAGAGELAGRFGADPERVHVIPHGAFGYLTHQADEQPLPDELARVEGPVVLSFGVLRPYKGVDVLVEAFRELEGAELWVVGRPWMDVEPLKRAAAGAGAQIRFIDRFVPDVQVPAFFHRADVVALPYRRIDQSGVLYTALAFAKAIVLSDVGGFSEVGRVDGAAELVAPGDPEALRGALRRLIADPAARARLEQRAAAAAAGRYSWDDIARRTLAVYEGLL
ncbi:MAG: glycosyltransferase family 4 protein [Thermoleophilaceae bacterium]